MGVDQLENVKKNLLRLVYCLCLFYNANGILGIFKLASNFDHLAFLDIGTSKAVLLLAEKKPSSNGDPNVSAHVVVPLKAIKKGVVVDYSNLIETVSKLIEEAQLMSGKSITQIVIGFSHPGFRGVNTYGVVNMDGQEIVQEDLDNVHAVARAVVMAEDESIFHMASVQTQVDHKFTENPVGSRAVRLEVSGHLVIGPTQLLQSFETMASQLGLDLLAVHHSGIAACWEVHRQNKFAQFCCIDMGAGTTDLVFWKNNTVYASHVIPIAGDHITNDIAISLRIPQAIAHQLKQQIDLSDNYSSDDYLVCQVGSVKHRISKCKVKRIIEARVCELLQMIKKIIQSNLTQGSDVLPIVLTGGTSAMSGFRSFCQQAFPWPIIDHQQALMWSQGQESEANVTYTVAQGLTQFFENPHQLPRQTSIDEELSWWDKLKQVVEENIV